MAEIPRRICLTGAECTGKTTLAAYLATHYGAIVVPEFAREYAERVQRELTSNDVEEIAKGQIALANSGLRTQNSGLVFDTDLISTVVYARHHYNNCAQWIIDAARARKSDFYLLLDIDQPWLADGIRDSGARREQLHDEFENALREFGARYVTISGGWDERLQRAIAAISASSSPQ